MSTSSGNSGIYSAGTCCCNSSGACALVRIYAKFTDYSDPSPAVYTQFLRIEFVLESPYQDLGSYTLGQLTLGHDGDYDRFVIPSWFLGIATEYDSMPAPTREDPLKIYALNDIFARVRDPEGRLFYIPEGFEFELYTYEYGRIKSDDYQICTFVTSGQSSGSGS